MAFPAQFIDEVRARIGLADVVGRRVKLVRRGREHSGLCPFHQEKSPSFTLNEDKGFFHCFGCGKHGSVFDFVMETEGLNFPEAVEKLALEAGLQIPEQSPQAAAQAQAQAGLYDVMELAAKWFQEQLMADVGQGARGYLRDRGVGKQAVDDFRMGFAPESRNALKNYLLARQVSEADIIEAGLAIKPDVGGAIYDRFRNRLMFPITDRRDRVIAFGGRALGEAKAKYLNSPETPLFQKRGTLYGLHMATPAARKSEALIVTEGYMDVIALSQAGFEGAVAPLGTALTEDQIQLLWKIVREPVLCFDGDAAGARAAAKAAERALPYLKPGYGLRFAHLPEGQDPDDMIKSGGAQAMQTVLDDAQPLSEVLWHMETGGRLPSAAEARAGLEARLKDHTRRIQDSTVRSHFSRLFGERLWPNRNSGGGGWNRNRSSNKNRNDMASANIHIPSDQVHQHHDAREIRPAALLAALINHPDCFDEMGEALGTIAFSAVELDNLRQQVLNTLAEDSGLDSASLITHLNQSGYADILGRVLSPDIDGQKFFARSDVARNLVLSGWRDALRAFRDEDLAQEIEEAKRISQANPTDEAKRWLNNLIQQKLALENEDAFQGL